MNQRSMTRNATPTLATAISTVQPLCSLKGNHLYRSESQSRHSTASRAKISQPGVGREPSAFGKSVGHAGHYIPGSLQAGTAPIGGDAANRCLPCDGFGNGFTRQRGTKQDKIDHNHRTSTGLAIGILGGAVSHIRAISSGVRPYASLTRQLISFSNRSASTTKARAGSMDRWYSSRRVFNAGNVEYSGMPFQASRYR